jgi:bifunctional non-homologous end joining protein LigD
VAEQQPKESVMEMEYKTIARTALAIQEGKRDAVYTADLLRDQKNGYRVRVQYGRRGSTMQETWLPEKGTVAYEAAAKLYRDRVSEKQGKGYQITDVWSKDEALKAPPPPPAAPRPQRKQDPHQLLNSVEDPDTWIASFEWWMQPKLDGVRAYLIRRGMDICAESRTGLPVVVHDDVRLAAIRVPGDPFVMDGEMCGNTFYAFDLVSWRDMDLTARDYKARLEFLEKTGINSDGGAIRLVKTFRTPLEKRQAFNSCKDVGFEGVVFKNPKAKYQNGRPNSGGCALKYKFVATATVVVVPKEKEDGKRSVEMAVRVRADEGKVKRRRVGTVTIPPNKDVPAPGTIIEVRYLYAYRDGCLIQPVYVGPRTDKPKADWYLTLQFKEEPRQPAAAPDTTVKASEVKGFNSWKEAADYMVAQRPPMGSTPRQRMCVACGMKLTPVNGKLPKHYAIGKMLCPKSDTDEHLPLPTAVEIEDPEAKAIIEEIAKHGWKCLCGHDRAQHRRKGPQGSGLCRNCVCEMYEPDSPSGDDDVELAVAADVAAIVPAEEEPTLRLRMDKNPHAWISITGNSKGASFDFKLGRGGSVGSGGHSGKCESVRDALKRAWTFFSGGHGGPPPPVAAQKVVPAVLQWIERHLHELYQEQVREARMERLITSASAEQIEIPLPLEGFVQMPLNF